ncbi:MAG: ABC transporter permease [Gemmatimonadetes bacterium]|nr:ABC transporter permease [Gemmatimonadota bacterium]
MTQRPRIIDLGPRHTDAAAEMREELALHVEASTERLIAQGWAPAAARAEAMRRLGGPRVDLEASATHKARRLAWREWATDLRDDTRYAWRGLVRQPLFAAVAILTIGVGIGANTAIYTTLDALLWRSLPFPEPGRLMDVVLSSPDEGSFVWSYPKYDFFRREQQAFASVAVHTAGPAILGGTEPQRIEVEEVSASYLSTLRIPVSHGGDFPATLDAAPGAARTAIISDALWQRHFNADAAVVGRTITIDNAPWEVIGVLPPSFRGLSGRADALLNLTARSADDLQQPWGHEFAMVARLRPDRSPADGTADAVRLGPRIYEAYPMKDGMVTTSKRPQAWGATARSLDTIRVTDALERSLLVLFGCVALVLLIACVNLANLLMARALARRQEMAVRLAIGARRGRIMRLLAAESLVLAGLGGLAGLGLAWIGARLLSQVNPRETLAIQGLEGGIGAVGFDQVHLDGRALMFTLLVTLGAAVLFGLVPAWRATRSTLTSDLRDGAAGSGAARRTGLSRRLLVVTEVALAVVLLATSGLMIRSLGKLLAVDPGFDATNVLTLRLSLPPGTFAPDSMPGFYDEVQQAIATLPGVERVALADCPPLNNGCNGTVMTFPDRPQSAAGNPMVGVHWVSPDWFRTLGVPLVRGRAFAPSDRIGTPRVVLLNEAAARRYFPGEDPIGRRVAVWQGGFHEGAEVIGIVGDVRFGTIDSTAVPDVFISYGQARIPRMMVFVRTSGEPRALVASVRAALQRVAPMAPVYDIRTLDDRVAAAGAQARFSATLLTGFAAVALALALMGIYGVMSFAVAQRTRELGVRMALGATRQQVVAMVLGESARLAVAGLAIGLVGAVAFTRTLRSMLYETTTTDPPTYAVMAVLLLATALLAGWIPARRAARIDPSGALRS